MVIAVFRSLEGESLEDYSIRLAQQWRIGQKGLDNGVILLVFVQDRKVRFEVGYGLEPVVPDAAAARIIREVIAPRFREGHYAAGLEAAVSAVFERIGSTGPAPPRGDGRGQRGGSPLWLLGLIGVFGVIALVLAREAFASHRFARRRAYTAGGRGWSAPVMASPWWGSRGGGWGGGGFSSGGGGFSGGGGSFGGGGASGDW
jgi:uncharacterized protein